MDNNKKLTTCKTCGKEIAKSADKCPHCGANLQSISNIIIRIIAFVLGVFLLVSGINTLSRINSQKPKRIDSNNITKQTDNLPKFTVGESAELNNIIVTLKSVKESKGSTYNEPPEGKLFANCEFEIQNNSTKEFVISSLLCCSAYCDDYKCEYSLTANGANLLEGKQTLDGNIAPGKKMLGVISYEIPKDWKELEIRFSPNVWKSKKFIFIATNPKHSKQQVED